MGLDISYFSKIEIDENFKSGVTTPEYYDYDVIYINPQPFDYQLCSLKVDSLYKLTENSEYDGFRAGSYGWYNTWRNNLAKLAGYETAENVWRDFNREIRRIKLKTIENNNLEKIKPFYELIFFSDCEGVIGPEICKKLYEDFVNFEDKAKKQDEYFYELYLKWKEAFRVASGSGLVSFH